MTVRLDWLWTRWLWNSSGCGHDLAVDLKPLCTSSHCEVPLWGFNFNWSGVLWFKLVESFILYFLGGVLFYTHYLRWSLFLARFRIIILKERGQPLDSTRAHRPRATESNFNVLGVYGEGGAGKMETAAQNECCM